MSRQLSRKEVSRARLTTTHCANSLGKTPRCGGEGRRGYLSSARACVKRCKVCKFSALMALLFVRSGVDSSGHTKVPLCYEDPTPHQYLRGISCRHAIIFSFRPLSAQLPD